LKPLDKPDEARYIARLRMEGQSRFWLVNVIIAHLRMNGVSIYLYLGAGMAQRNARIIGGIYRIGQTITHGGMLTSYTAYNHNTNDVVGLFVIEFPPALQSEAIEQLLRQLEQRRALQSPHVLRVHDWGIDGSRIYIVTDPPRGVTLQHVLDTEDIGLPRALDITRQIAAGLKVFHEHNIAGLDLRPQLITVDTFGITDRVQIDDVGLRPLLSAIGTMSDRPGQEAESFDPRYTAPEYISGVPISPRSDVYMAGLLLFELVTGRVPFVGRNYAETGIMQCTYPIPRMSLFKHDTPPTLQDIVDCALAKDPVQRFAHGAALLKALEGVQLPPAIGPVMQDTKLTQAIGKLTDEMSPQDNEDDVTLRATLIEEHTTIPAIPRRATQNAAAETVYAYLCSEREGARTQRIAIKQKSVIVGRIDPKRGFTPDIDLSALDPGMTVSRQHARISFEETFFSIEDLKSHNKTRLNQQALAPLKAELLQHGDILYFGKVRMKFEVAGLKDLSPQ
jgi:serine/threonine protein kinase